MKHLLHVTLFLVLAAISASAQVKSEETITTTDTSGRTTTVSVTTLSKTEDITPRADIILMSPIEFIQYYNISYIHSMSNNLAVGGGFRLAHDLSEEFDVEIEFGLTLEGRFYPGKKAVKGFYLAPNLAVNWLANHEYTYDYDPQTGRTNRHDNKTTGMGFTIGLMSGWQFFPWEEMAMGAGLGFEHHILATSVDTENTFGDYNGRTVPAVRFDIGYAW